LALTAIAMVALKIGQFEVFTSTIALRKNASISLASGNCNW